MREREKGKGKGKGSDDELNICLGWWGFDLNSDGSLEVKSIPKRL